MQLSAAGRADDALASDNHESGAAVNVPAGRWVRAAVLLLGLSAAMATGCSGSKTAAGLEVLLLTDMRTPEDFDTLRVEISQQVAPGQFSPPLFAYELFDSAAGADRRRRAAPASPSRPACRKKIACWLERQPGRRHPRRGDQGVDITDNVIPFIAEEEEKIARRRGRSSARWTLGEGGGGR